MVCPGGERAGLPGEPLYVGPGTLHEQAPGILISLLPMPNRLALPPVLY